eukprot:scaffold13221_cov100-Isochrysis_galbana.AAC.2
MEESAISRDAYPMYMLAWGGLVFTEDIKAAGTLPTSTHARRGERRGEGTEDKRKGLLDSKSWP